MPVFFVLSGFVVSLPFARHALRGAPAPDLGRYFLRRVSRIQPPYFLAIATVYLLTRRLNQNLPSFLASLIYSHHYLYGYTNPFAVYTWSLEVEVSFYLLAPWLCRIYRITGNHCRWFLQVVLILLTSGIASHWLARRPLLEHTLLTEISYFLAGMLFADIYCQGFLRRSGRFAWDVGAVLFLIGLVDVAGWKIWLPGWLAPLMILLLFVCLFEGRLANWLVRLPPVTVIGGMCYTLYLWHEALISQVPYQFKIHFIRLTGNSHRDAAAYALLMVALLLVTAIPIYLVTERPFMNGLGSRFIEKSIRSILL